MTRHVRVSVGVVRYLKRQCHIDNPDDKLEPLFPGHRGRGLFPRRRINRGTPWSRGFSASGACLLGARRQGSFPLAQFVSAGKRSRETNFFASSPCTDAAWESSFPLPLAHPPSRHATKKRAKPVSGDTHGTEIAAKEYSSPT